MIGSVIVGILTAFILLFVSKKAQRKRIEEDELGNFTFRLPKYFLFIGITMLVFTIIFAFLVPITNNEDFFYSVVLFGLFGIGGLWMVLFYSSYLVNISDKEINYISIFTKEIRMNWEAIEQIEYKPKRGSIIASDTVNKIVIHQQILGLDQLLEFIEKKKGITKEELKIN
jgi:amino acid transporter